MPGWLRAGRGRILLPLGLTWLEGIYLGGRLVVFLAISSAASSTAVGSTKCLITEAHYTDEWHQEAMVIGTISGFKSSSSSMS